MKSLATFTLLALLASTNAQYFSAGWSPEQKQLEAKQPVPSKPVSVAAEPATAASPLSPLNVFDTTKILRSGPSVALFNRFGINITERMETASLAKIWDERVPLITDDNYDHLIINEALTEQEELDRVWIIAMHVSFHIHCAVVLITYLQFGDFPKSRWSLQISRQCIRLCIQPIPYHRRLTACEMGPHRLPQCHQNHH